MNPPGKGVGPWLGVFVGAALAFTQQPSVHANDPNAAARAAVKAAEDALKEAQKELKKLDEVVSKGAVGKEDSSFMNIELFTGAKLQNPYSVEIDSNAKTATLDPSKSTPVAFVELNVFARHIFRTGVYDSTFTTNEATAPVSWKFLPFNRDGYFLPEFDFRVGYAFRNKKPDKFEAATIAGGSDLYLEGGIGQPFFRVSNHDDWKGQLTIELAGGFTTDDAFNRVHPNLFVGGGAQMAYTPDGEQKVGLGNTYVLFRFGYASFDQPRLTSGRNVALDDFNLPEFEQVWAPSVGSTLLFKISAGLSFQLSSNVYFADRASWNVSAGLSLDPSQFFKR